MIIFKNGDRCPCCGETIDGKNDEWLELFSQFVNALSLEKYPEKEIDLEPIGFQPPPDAGINPPVIVKPKI